MVDLVIETPTFAQWWERHGKPYEAAVIANGGTPWQLDPEKRAAAAAKLGLPEDSDPMELRRALWQRRYSRRTATEHQEESNR